MTEGDEAVADDATDPTASAASAAEALDESERSNDSEDPTSLSFFIPLASASDGASTPPLLTLGGDDGVTVLEEEEGEDEVLLWVSCNCDVNGRSWSGKSGSTMSSSTSLPSLLESRSTIRSCVSLPLSSGCCGASPGGGAVLFMQE